MAEKGVVVADAAAGESVACRDAIQQDDDSNSRIIQLVDKAARPVTYQVTTPLRSIIGSAPDGTNLSTVPSEITSAILDVSDAESFVFWAVINVGSSASTSLEIRITPLILSEDVTPVLVTMLPPFRLLPVFPDPSETMGESGQITIGTRTIPTIVQVFPTHGATNIGFHVTILNGNGDDSVDIYAEPTSGVGRNSAFDDDVLSGTYGTALAFAGV